ncbi:MAG: 3'-5' exonuclease [Pseudanabaenaceae cyanobacterium bins.68]|nr:3'-5' exonuclease [Pseudanabaenaceae cyanobacterium bins.68]
MVRSIDILQSYRQFADQQFTVVDLETTGGKPNSSRAIEIAVIHASLAKGIIAEYSDLINPQTLVPSQITRLTGISQKMVDGGVPSEQLWFDYLPHLSQGVFTAHNLNFDYGFIQMEYRRLGINYQRPSNAKLCTVQFSRLLLPHLKSRSLPNLVQHFNFPVGKSHRAAADTRACWLLLEKLFEQLAIESQELLLERIGQEWLDLTAAAAILGLNPDAAQLILEAERVNHRFSQRRFVVVYQRCSVEALAEQLRS